MHTLHVVCALFTGIALTLGSASQAAVVVYSDETLFQGALGADFTVVNLDGAPLDGLAAPYNVEDTVPAAAFASLGIDFQVFNAQVVAGQAGQISKPGRDRLITNGAGFGGTLQFDLLTPGNGVGAWSNDGDGGLVRAYSGSGLTGMLIAEAAFGPGSFGGLISTDLIQSVEITCVFNNDLRCGVFDIQYGTVVPIPAAAWLLGTGLVGLAGWNRTRTGFAVPG